MKLACTIVVAVQNVRTVIQLFSLYGSIRGIVLVF